MQKIIYKSRVLLRGIIILFLMISCNSWLDILPENQQTIDKYWKTKEDVESVVMSGYIRLKSCLEKFVQWGELRGDALKYTGSSTDEQNIITLQILTTNSVTNWSSLYKVIGAANAVITYAPSVQTHDETFLTEVMNSYIAEATFQRSLCYFWLLRTFHEVPLVLEPYVDDSAPYIMPKSSERELIDQLISDLTAIISYARPGYSTPEESKGRATRWAVYALLADIYLWDEQYDKCIEYCNEIIGQFELLPSDQWYELYYPGNSEESIFELNYNQSKVSTDNNNLYTWFYGSSPKYSISESTLEIIDGGDLRGEGGSYWNNNVWKYAGISRVIQSAFTRGSNQRDANWIFYRLPDIYLMKAEALVVSSNGNSQMLEEAIELVNIIRRRAELTKDIITPPTVEDCLEIVLNERQIEFLGEGKRWFDILRTAKRNNYENRYYLINILLNGLSAQDRPIYEAKLQDEYGYFLPIRKNEIDNSGDILIQNPYYSGLD